MYRKVILLTKVNEHLDAGTISFLKKHTDWSDEEICSIPEKEAQIISSKLWKQIAEYVEPFVYFDIGLHKINKEAWPEKPQKYCTLASWASYNDYPDYVTFIKNSSGRILVSCRGVLFDKLDDGLQIYLTQMSKH